MNINYKLLDLKDIQSLSLDELINLYRQGYILSMEDNIYGTSIPIKSLQTTTTITIPLQEGQNYISFPATSTDNFQTIFTNSGIINNVTAFNRFDAFEQAPVPLDYSEYIMKGTGYYIEVKSLGTIAYTGTPYILSFNDIQSKLVLGQNLIGPGSDSITPETWCKIIDPTTNLQVSILQPKHAYWILFDNCNLVSTTNVNTFNAVITGLGLLISAIFLWIELRATTKVETEQKGIEAQLGARRP